MSRLPKGWTDTKEAISQSFKRGRLLVICLVSGAFHFMSKPIIFRKFRGERRVERPYTSVSMFWLVVCEVAGKESVYF